MANKEKTAAPEKEHKKNWRETHASLEDIQKFLNGALLLRHNVITGDAEFRVPEKDEFDALATCSHSPHAKYFSPKSVSLIIDYLGEP